MAFLLTINGAAVAAAETFDVINPADESVVAACPQASRDQIDDAVAAAKLALPNWSGTADAERAEALSRIADLIEAHHAELSELLTREQGKTQAGPGSNLEVSGATAWTRATAALTLPEETVQDDERGRIVMTRKPVGVVASITPWNWPLMIAVWHIMPAIRVGCTVVIKPSPFTPLSTLRLVELMNRVLPPGVINAIAGGGPAGTQLAEHPAVGKVVFTGSTPTGQTIMRSAVPTLKRLTLELGGNDAGIILPGTRIEPLLEKLFWGCFLNAGQTCACLKRLYVHEDQYDEVVNKLAAFAADIPMGDGLNPKNLIGPLTNAAQRDYVAELVAEAHTQGARIVTGGKTPEGKGYFYPITVVADVSDDMRLAREEQFGPAIPVLKYRSVDEAITRANALDVGLGGSVWADDPVEAEGYARRLECGTAWVNQHGTLHPLACFGGIKRSGFGTEFNVDGLKEYTTIQTINVAY
jgi:acyl-CoA reductase-like NAD-dependent aldehyde dehydrogenase